MRANRWTVEPADESPVVQVTRPGPSARDRLKVVNGGA
jgi:hypothetical protein